MLQALTVQMQGRAHSGRHRPPLRKNNHHSDKIATTTNSLDSTKYQHEWKCLTSIVNCFTQHICTYICSVYKEYPRHCLSIEIKDHNFWRFNSNLYNQQASKPGHIPEMLVQLCFCQVHTIRLVIFEGQKFRGLGNLHNFVDLYFHGISTLVP